MTTVTPPDDPPDSSPSAAVVVLSYLAVFIAGIAAWLIYTRSDPKPLLIDVDGFAIFAPLYIAAQAIERFLEPWAARFGQTTTEKFEVKRTRQELVDLKALPAGDPARTATALAAAERAVTDAEAALARAKSRRTISLWAAATTLGFLVCAMLGLGLIEAIAKDRPDSEFIRTVDVLLTGLAVGAGTKPLHDLIARIEKAKDNADPATTPTTPSPAPTSPTIPTAGS